MAQERVQAGLIAGLLLALTAACLVVSAHTSRVGAPGIRMALPERVLEYTGAPILFCQNDQCGRSFPCTGSAAPTTCPVCGAALDVKALAEKRILPADTQIVRRRYTRPGGQSFLVSIVLSGVERRSIHPPQVCLIGQGYRITDERVARVPLPHGGELRATKMQVSPPHKTDNPSPPPEVFAYWFVSGTHQTPYHLTRLMWTAWEGAVRNCRPRWAYVAISGPSGGAPAGEPEPWQKLVAKLYEDLRSNNVQ